MSSFWVDAKEGSVKIRMTREVVSLYTYYIYNLSTFVEHRQIKDLGVKKGLGVSVEVVGIQNPQASRRECLEISLHQVAEFSKPGTLHIRNGNAWL